MLIGAWGGFGLCAPLAEIIIAWALAPKPRIAPIPGTTKLYRLEENNTAATIGLSGEELREIGAAAAAIEIVGARYPEHIERMTGS